MPGLLGKKIGMTSVFSADGKNVPCTVIEVGPCVVTQIKSVEKDGYAAVQVGYQDAKEKNVSAPLLGHFKKAGVTPKRHLAEFSGFDKELNLGDTLTYEPNSYHEWQEQQQYMEPPQHICGDSGHWDYTNDDEDYFAQPRALFLLMSADQRQALFDNTARAMADVPEFIRQRHLEHCYRCHRDYGEGVENAFAAMH